MNLNSGLILATCAMALASTGCVKPLKSAYDLKRSAACVIGAGEGVPTVWNQATAPELGQVYYRTQAATPTSSVFVDRVKTFSRSKEVNGAPWVYDLTRKSTIESQLGYMGVEADFSSKPVKVVHFSAQPGSLSEIREWEDNGLLTLLNEPNYGPKLRNSVLLDMANRKSEQDTINSHYWIVTSILTAKDLKVSVEKASNWSGALKIADLDKLKAVLGTSKLPSASFEVGQNGSGTTMSLGTGGETALVVWMYPLSARMEGGKVWMYVDRSTKPLAAVNILKAE